MEKQTKKDDKMNGRSTDQNYNFITEPSSPSESKCNESTGFTGFWIEGKETTNYIITRR